MPDESIEYTCSCGETYDLVALIVYGNEKYTPELLNANPAYCDRIVFDGGEVLTVPIIAIEDEIEAASSAAPWR